MANFDYSVVYIQASDIIILSNVTSKYFDRKQKKIETTKYDKDLIKPNEDNQKKLLEMAMKNLIFMEENRSKIRKRKAPQRGESSKKK